MPQNGRPLHEAGCIRRCGVSQNQLGHIVLLADFVRVYLNQVLKIFSGRQHLINELARTTFKKGALFRLVGDNSKAEETMARAYELRRQLMPRDVRPLTELTEKDFDMLVVGRVDSRTSEFYFNGLF